MGPSGFILLMLALWLAVIAFVLVHALLTGRIRMGGPGAEPIHRCENPGAFWATLALSLGGLMVGGLVLGWILKTALPAPWAEAMRTLGW